VTQIGLDGRLAEEVVKIQGLERELSQVKASFLEESDEHKALCITIQLICDDLELAPEQQMRSLMTRAVQIIDQAREIMRHVLYFGV
jgi:hypothetical protein